MLEERCLKMSEEEQLVQSICDVLSVEIRTFTYRRSGSNPYPVSVWGLYDKTTDRLVFGIYGFDHRFTSVWRNYLNVIIDGSWELECTILHNVSSKEELKLRLIAYGKLLSNDE